MIARPEQSKLKSSSGFFIFRGILLISLLFSILLGLTVWLESQDFDRKFSSQFYTSENGWFLADSFLWQLLYDYGVIPGILFSVISIVILLTSRTNSRLSSLRPHLYICALAPFIASLFLVNIVLKDHTGRPRPREIVQFNGNWDYKPVLEKGTPGRGHSFPCGHCSIAFTLTSGVVFWQRSRKFALTSLVLGLTYGILMSSARIVQGGHFLSDAFWALGIVWLTLLSLYYFVFQPPQTENKPSISANKKQKWKIAGAAVIFLAVLSLFIWNRRPFYKDHLRSFEILSNITQLEVNLPEKWMVVPPIYEKRQNGVILLEIQGFAPPHTTHYLNFTSKTAESTAILSMQETVEGYQREFRQVLKLRLPERIKGNFKIITEQSATEL
ncbi:MAG: phosphatase PAP2 family protein [SAR324 cluster bacterium]|nr:phosphatase PAP2 family protein [SAR324 cluster bacterium]MBL7035681.1 phosphatase PAP2 family protein [SAR324 cluster bacterium]